MKRLPRKPLPCSTEDASRLLAGFAIDVACNRYAVRVKIRGRVITFVLTERRK